MMLVHKKDSRSDPAKCLPISLFLVVGKVFERIVVDAISHHLDDSSLLSDQQFGFRSEVHV